MFYVYVLHSEKLNRFYIGQTHDVELRLLRHNSNYYENKWTKKGIPWNLFLKIDCRSKPQALQIELHLKKMKSKKYIQNLKLYPEIISKLKKQYPS